MLWEREIWGSPLVIGLSIGDMWWNFLGSDWLFGFQGKLMSGYWIEWEGYDLWDPFWFELKILVYEFVTPVEKGRYYIIFWLWCLVSYQRKYQHPRKIQVQLQKNLSSIRNITSTNICTSRTPHIFREKWISKP